MELQPTNYSLCYINDRDFIMRTSRSKVYKEQSAEKHNDLVTPNTSTETMPGTYERKHITLRYLVHQRSITLIIKFLLTEEFILVELLSIVGILS